MLNVESRFMIRDLHRKGVTISEIARRTGYDRKTIRAVVKGPVSAAPQKRQAKASKLARFVPHLKQRIADGVLNCNKLFAEIQKQGYQGGKSLVKDFVQPYRAARQAPQATVRYETAPDEQGQARGRFGLRITVLRRDCAIVRG